MPRQSTTVLDIKINVLGNEHEAYPQVIIWGTGVC